MTTSLATHPCPVSGAGGSVLHRRWRGAGGELKPNKLRLVQAWIEIHRDELLADWLLASQGQTIFTIDPLK